MGIHIYGNDPNQTLTVTSGDISGDLVIFGNGAGDNVLAEFTAVSGAAAGNISNSIIPLASFILSLNSHSLNAHDTFIVTDTASGQTGAIELTGVAFQHSTLANHVLTLHA